MRATDESNALETRGACEACTSSNPADEPGAPVLAEAGGGVAVRGDGGEHPSSRPLRVQHAHVVLILRRKIHLAADNLRRRGRTLTTHLAVM